MAKEGRPFVVTEDVADSLERSFQHDASVVQACAIALISTDAYYDHLKRDDKFSDKMKRAQKEPYVLAQKTIKKAIERGDGKLALKWAERRDKKRYALRTELTGDEGTPLNITIKSYADVSSDDEDTEDGEE